MKIVHQEKRVRRCREVENENYTPGKADLVVHVEQK